MRRRCTVRGTHLLLALVLTACDGDDIAGPNFSGPPTSVSLRFCGSTVPAWVGYQNGNGAWTTVAPSAASTYTFSVNGGGALGYVLPNGGNAASFGYSTEIVYASAEELAKFVVPGCTATLPFGSKTIRGALTAIGANELGEIYLGRSSASVASSSGTANFTLRRVADAAQDLIAVRRTTLSTAGDIARLIIRRGINPLDGATMASLDFNGPEAVQPLSSTVKLEGTQGELITVSSAFSTAGGSSLLLSGIQTTDLAAPFAGLANASIGTDDLHAITLSAQDSPTTLRAVETFFRQTGNRTVAMGPRPTEVKVTAASTTPNIRLRMEIPAVSEYQTAAVAEYTSGGFGALSRTFEIAVTGAYLGRAPGTWTITMPDLTGAVGYDANFGMITGLALEYMAIVTGGNRLFFSAPADGETMRYAVRQGSFISSPDALPGITQFLAPRESRLLPFLRRARPLQLTRDAVVTGTDR